MLQSGCGWHDSHTPAEYGPDTTVEYNRYNRRSQKGIRRRYPFAEVDDCLAEYGPDTTAHRRSQKGGNIRSLSFPSIAPTSKPVAAPGAEKGATSPFGIPVPFPETAFAAQAVAMGARHIVSKAAFVNINNGLARLTMRLDPIPEAVPIAVVRLWVLKGFFICRPRFAQDPKDGIRGNAKPCGTLVPIGVGILLTNIPRLGCRINLAVAWLAPIRLRALQPTAKRSAPDTKSPRVSWPFLLAEHDGENQCNKSCRIVS